MRDSAFLEVRGCDLENRKHARKHLDPIAPLYTKQDAAAAMRRFRAVDFDQPFEPVKGLRVVLRPAGHILGASIVQLSDTSGARLTFSVDLGSSDAPLFPQPARTGTCDLLLTESTYGDRAHRPLDETWREVGEIIAQANSNRGNILIPAFAVGRTQQILYAFRQHFSEWELDRWQIFLDSPLATDACEIHDRHLNLLRPEIRRIASFLGPAQRPRDAYGRPINVHQSGEKRRHCHRRQRHV